MDGITGWDGLLKHTCEDIIKQGEEDHVFIRYRLARKMTTSYRMYQLCLKSWPLLHMIEDYRKTFDNEAFRANLIPSIKDCLYSLHKVETLAQACKASIKLSKLATPAHIRVSDPEGKLIDYREPVFQPFCDRNKQMTEIIFQCIQDLEIPMKFDSALIHDYSEKVSTRFLFYIKLFLIFQYEYWPADLCKDFEENNSDPFPVFHRLLQIEVDTLIKNIL